MANHDIRQIAMGWKHTPYKYGGGGHNGIDCSHFVWEVIKAAGHPSAGYVSTGDVSTSAQYSRITNNHPSVGDIVVFDGHMGIVVDATSGTFMGAQSGGVDEESYTQGYWSSRHPKFYRYTGP